MLKCAAVDQILLIFGPMNRTVELVILVGAFALLALLGTTWIGTAILAGGANRTACVIGYNPETPNEAIQICESDTWGAKNAVHNIIEDQRGDRF